MNRQRKFAIAGVTGAMLVGAGTGVVLNLPSGAGAATSTNSATIATTAPPDSTESDSTTATDDSTTESTTESTTDDSATPKVGRGEFLKSALDELVAAGTITQAQADAILAGVEAKAPVPGDGTGPGGMGGPGRGGKGHGGFGGRGGASLEAAATALGITTDELKTELQADKTIADVATEKGVDVDTVIDAMVTEATAVSYTHLTLPTIYSV